MRLVLFNIGWMNLYRGETPDGPVVGGGANEVKYEVENFLPIGGWH